MRSLLSLLTLVLAVTVSNGQTVILQKEAIDSTITAWHKAASDADFDAYFGLMTDTAVFVGTDVTENWNVEAFKAYAKPHFDRGSAWSFSKIERNVYLDAPDSKIAWFDEHLSTQMGICRGSGLLIKKDGTWKIQHYVLSIAVPNEYVSTLTTMKKEWDHLQIKKMLKKM